MTTAAALAAAAVVLAGCSNTDSAADRGDLAGAPTASPASPALQDIRPLLTPTTAPPAPVVGRRAATLAPRSAPAAPVRVEIASVGIDARVDPVGVRDDGEMELPADPDVLGWYRFGPTPSQLVGSVVVGGHIDSKTYGIGQLARLRDVDVGAEVVVESEDGGVSRYRVLDVQSFDKVALPVQELFRRDGGPVLRLVTCGGDFLEDRGSYEQNLVVTAVPA